MRRRSICLRPALEPAKKSTDIPIRRLDEPYQAADLQRRRADRACLLRRSRRCRRRRLAATRSIGLPSTELLNEPPARNAYDEQELKDIAGRIKAKFEEFNVLGTVVQINPGPVVTTFEFKPEAGIKYSRITTLTEDLCLGLAGRIDPDRAHSRQADRRHRSAEHHGAK